MAYFVFVTVAFLGLTVAGLLVLRRGAGEPARASAWFFLASIALVLLVLGAGRPLEAALGVVVVALGSPAYRFLVRTEPARG